MNVEEKIAPLVVLQNTPPAYVESIRFDDGADGEMWIYVNAPASRDASIRPRYLGFVARADSFIGVEITEVTNELDAWLANTSVQAADYAATELVRLQNIATAVALAQSQAFAAQETALHVTALQQQYDQEVAAAVVSMTEALNALKLGDDLAALAALAVQSEHEDLAATVKAQLDAQMQAIAQSTEVFLTSLTATLMAGAAEQAAIAGAERAELLANSPPPRLADRLAELQATLGCLVAHQSTSPGQAVLLVPGDVEAFVQAQADWLADVQP